MFAQLKNVESLAKQGRFQEIETIYKEAWASKVRHLGAGRLYSENVVWAFAHEPEEAEDIPAYLEPFAKGFADNPSAFMAALYSMALQQAAGVAPGSAYARDTSAAQFAAYEHYNGLALEVLLGVDNVTGEDLPWWEARYNVSQSCDESPEERHKWFEGALACDPGNLSLFYSAMISALPRWEGKDETDAERVARRAMELNRAEMGAGGYSLAYGQFANVDDLLFTETAVDVTLLERGFRDLLQRMPSLVLMNKFVRTMSWAGIESVVKQCFESGFHQIDCATWDGDDEEDAVDTAARAYVWAKRNAE